MGKSIGLVSSGRHFYRRQPKQEEGREVKAPAVRPSVKATEDDKFEVKATLDGAWYDATLELRDGELNIHYNGFNENDGESWNVGKVKKLKPICDFIRILSVQLQDKDCRNVSLNMRVCAFYETPRVKTWFDAVVTERAPQGLFSIFMPFTYPRQNAYLPLKVTRRPHILREGEEVCQCRFVAMWQHGPRKGQPGKLRCNQICLPSEKDVETHPLLVDVLHAANNVGGSQDRKTENATLKTTKKEDLDANVPGCGQRPKAVRTFKRLRPMCSTKDEVKEEDNPTLLSGITRDSSVQPAHLSLSPKFCGNHVKTDFSSVAGSKEKPIEEISKSISTNTDFKENVCISTGFSSLSHSRQEPCDRRQSVCSSCIESPSPCPESSFLRDDKPPGFNTQKGGGDHPIHRVLPHNVSQTGGVEDFGGVGVAKVEPNLQGSMEHKRMGMEIDEGLPGKKVRITVDIELNAAVTTSEELKGSVDNMFKQPKINISAGQSFNGHSKGGPNSWTLHSGKELHVKSGSYQRPHVSKHDVVCLSDDEDESGYHRDGAGMRPFRSTSSTSGGDPILESKGHGNTPSRSGRLINPSAGFHTQRVPKQSCNFLPIDPARSRDSLLSKLLAKSDCVLTIDNLEPSVRAGDVLEQLLLHFPEERVHSVHIPPPYPDVNHAVGYAVFKDKAAADSVGGFFSRCFIVSARGRPWIVTRNVQELGEDIVGFPTVSAFKGEVPCGKDHLNEVSSSGLRLITESLGPEYKAAQERKRLFEEHRKQTRLLFQRLSREEAELESNPGLILYH